MPETTNVDYSTKIPNNVGLMDDQRVLSDPEYGQALDAGGVFAEALRAAEAVLRAGVPVLPGTHK